MTTAFTGFPRAVPLRSTRLEADNIKSFWTVHRHRYEDAVSGPMRALLESLAPSSAGSP